MKAEIKIPNGYRKLSAGEYMRPGDLVLSFPGMEWVKEEECVCQECEQPIKSAQAIPNRYRIVRDK